MNVGPWWISFMFMTTPCSLGWGALGAIHSRRPPWSGAVAEGRGGNMLCGTWYIPAPLVAHPQALGVGAVLLSACLPAHSGQASLSWQQGSQVCHFPTITFFVRRWKKTERGDNERAWTEQVLDCLSVCLQLLHLPQGRDHSDWPPASCMKSLPPPCHCVCPGWGGGMRSLRLRLGVLTKGERRDHLSSKPGKTRDPPGSQEIGFWFIVWDEQVAGENCIQNNKYRHTLYKGCGLAPFSHWWGQSKLLRLIHFAAWCPLTAHFWVSSTFPLPHLQCLLGNMILFGGLVEAESPIWPFIHSFI